MNFKAILEYQKCDIELANLQTQFNNLDSVKNMQKGKELLKQTADKIKKSISVMNDVVNNTTKLENKITELIDALGQFKGVTEDVKEVKEYDYYIKEVEKIKKQLDKCVEALKILKAGSKSLDDYNTAMAKKPEYEEYATAWKKAAKDAFDQFKVSANAMNKKLKDLESECPEALLKKYKSLKEQGIKLPIIVPYDTETKTCGRCFMAVEQNTQSKLKNPGDFAECPNCHRILYID